MYTLCRYNLALEDVMVLDSVMVKPWKDSGLICVDLVE